MGNQQERLAFDIGWLVGIIEGEGSVVLARKACGLYPSIQIGNCNQGIIDRLIRILRSMDIGWAIGSTPRITAAGKVFKRIDVGGYKRLMRFFKVVKPDYFEGKRHEIDLLVEYLKIRTEKEPNSPHGNAEESIWSIFRSLGR